MIGACRPMPSQSANSVSSAEGRQRPEPAGDHHRDVLARGPVWPMSHADGQGDDRGDARARRRRSRGAAPMRSGMLPDAASSSRGRGSRRCRRGRGSCGIDPLDACDRRGGAPRATSGRDHGMSRRPISTHAQSSTSASRIVATMPVKISAWMPRWNPSVKRLPRLCTPITAPTVARLTVLTTTTRRPDEQHRAGERQLDAPEPAQPRSTRSRSPTGARRDRPSRTRRRRCAR